MSGFNIEVEVYDTVDAWISTKNLINQISRFDISELEELQQTILYIISQKGGLPSKRNLQEDFIREIMEPVIQRISITQAEEISKQYIGRS